MNTISRVNKNYKSGDQGGRLFPIPESEGKSPKNLHQVWESGLYSFHEHKELVSSTNLLMILTQLFSFLLQPLADEEWERLSREAW